MIDFRMPEISSWEYIAKSENPVIVYGMGNGADKVIDELARLNVDIAGVTASDDFVRGQIFHGFKVKKLSDFTGNFILAIAFGSGLTGVINHIRNLSKNFDVIVPVVPVYGNEIINKEFIDNYCDDINRAYSLFDDFSKKIFSLCLSFMYSGRLDYLEEADIEKNEIFENFMHLSGDETYLDLGAYRGDTIDEFLRFTGGKYKKIIAVEPDKKTFVKLKNNTGHLENIEYINKAISDKPGYLTFDNAGGRNSSVSSYGKLIECTTVDEISEDNDITYLKADVEGQEMNMINGAVNTLKLQKPVLNIALYHRSRDFFEIPLKIKEINPSYKFNIRKHPYIPCWDMNLYAK